MAAFENGIHTDMIRSPQRDRKNDDVTHARELMFEDRLKLARKKAGLSLRSLAEALGNQVSAQAIGKYERGEMMPSSSTLLALARTLDVSLDYLMGTQVQQLDGVEFRKKSGTTVKERARVEAAVIEHVERYLTIEETLDLDSAEWHQPFDKQCLKTLDEAEALANRVRKVWHLGEDPVPNMTELLEERGIKVLITPLPESVSGMTYIVKRSGGLPEVPVIVVNRVHTLERRRLTLAHELAHRLIHEDSPVDHEKASTCFAGAFLVPRAHLEREIGKHRNGFGYYELSQLKRMYRVSAAAFLIRLKAIGIIDESTMAYAFRTFARGWRREEPKPLEASGQEGTRERAQRYERLCYWALAENLISPGKASELLQCPLRQIESAMKGPVGTHADYCQGYLLHE
jgi:Zn-dependent peptidase ImmA (M78 family)/transcriptional regulator with XRE-family HTH domain